MKLQVGYETRRGSRHTKNQDAVTTGQDISAELVAQKGRLLAVADGFGPDEAGAGASLAAVTTLSRSYYGSAEPDLTIALRQAIVDANTTVVAARKTDAAAGNTGSTLTAAVVRDGTLHVASVGDSRVYVLHDRKLKRLTEDDTWASEQVKTGLMKPEDAAKDRRHDQLSRALGVGPALARDTLTSQTSVFGPADRLLLCTDGLNDVLPDADIARALAPGDPAAVASRLVTLATRRRGSDDISVVVALSQPPRKTAPWLPAGIAGFVVLLVAVLVLTTRQPVPPAGAQLPITEAASSAALAAVVTPTETALPVPPTSTIAPLQPTMVARPPVLTRAVLPTGKPATPVRAGLLFPAPILSAPGKDAQYTGPNAEVRLAWEPVSGLTPADRYVVISDFTAATGEWRDWQVTDNPVLNVPRYLYDQLSEPRRIRWHVVVWRNARQNAAGQWEGEPVSPDSETRAYYWRSQVAESTATPELPPTPEAPTPTPAPPPG